MFKQMETEIKVGVFVTTGVGLIMLAILFLGGGKSFFTRSVNYTAHFNRVDGLITGAKVILNGVPVGTVDAINFDKEKRDIRVHFSLASDSRDWIRKDSTAEIATQGVLGDKYISIRAGSEGEPELPPNSDIAIRPSQDISQFLSKGDILMVSLNSIAVSLDKILRNFEANNRSEIFFKGMAETSKNLSQATEKLNRELDQIKIKGTIASLNQIFEKVNNGTGTIGALINDPSLYDEVTALMGGANRNRIIRNLVRQTIHQNKNDSPSPTPSSEPNQK